jgi:5-formyltetrahydrofolate cyclo-ligase
VGEQIQSKAELRAAALRRRDALTAHSRDETSTAIGRRVQAILAAIHPKSIGTYRAFGSEVEPAAIISSCATAGVPIGLATMLDADVMVFRRYTPGDNLVHDAYRILAPEALAETIDPDVLIVPISAFDRSGMRLGKGRGVYDRAIAAFRARGLDPRLVGIAFSVQEVPPIPAEPHDVRLDWLVTENLTLEFPRGSLAADSP